MKPDQKKAFLELLTEDKDTFDRVLNLVRSKVIAPREVRALFNLDGDE